MSNWLKGLLAELYAPTPAVAKALETAELYAPTPAAVRVMDTLEVRDPAGDWHQLPVADLQLKMGEQFLLNRIVPNPQEDRVDDFLRRGGPGPGERLPVTTFGQISGSFEWDVAGGGETFQSLWDALAVAGPAAQAVSLTVTQTLAVTRLLTQPGVIRGLHAALNRSVPSLWVTDEVMEVAGLRFHPSRVARWPRDHRRAQTLVPRDVARKLLAAADQARYRELGHA